MADVAISKSRATLGSETNHVPQPIDTSSSTAVPTPKLSPGVRNGHLNLDTFSPVNQNGSFAFDRVLKSGEVLKRTRKTKQWKSFYLVLRPNLLSLYKNSTEDRLRKQLSLSDLTAVGYLKDPKGRREHVFGLFSPSRNFHLQAKSAADAQAWVELIKQEACIDEEDQDVYLRSPTTQEHPGHDRHDHERFASSSPEPFEVPPRHSTTRDGIRIPSIRRLSAHDLEYSGDELAPYSDLSDTPPQSYTKPSFGSLMQQNRRTVSHNSIPYIAPQQRPVTTRNASQASGFYVEQDEEKVIWHGYLLCLKTKGGVKQWKKLWVVLRLKNLAFYKNNEEYAANLILPLSSIINAVEIDPVSRSKAHCMQIIAEEKSYRFCASSEDALAEWLGALKSQLARRKEVSSRKNIAS